MMSLLCERRPVPLGHRPTSPSGIFFKETSSLYPSVWTSISPEDTEADAGEPDSYRCLLEVTVNTQVFFLHGITLTQATLIPLGRNVIATSPSVMEKELKQVMGCQDERTRGNTPRLYYC